MGFRLVLYEFQRRARRRLPRMLRRRVDIRAPWPVDQTAVRKAVLILGGEGTGTRLVAELLSVNGVWGDLGHHQRLDSFDGTLLSSCGERLFWRRSLPHADDWPELDRMLGLLTGFQVQVVITTRAWNYMLQAQTRARHVDDTGAAMGRAQEAYARALDFVARNRLPYVLFSYDALLAQPQRQQEWLLGWLGIEGRRLLAIRDENQKYLGG